MVAHRTNGQIPRLGGTDELWDGAVYQTVAVADLELTYSGSLAQQQWVSLVDQRFNSDQPCALGSVAAGRSIGVSAASDASDVLAAASSSRVVTVDTLQMSATLIFAVCYAETDGTSSDSTWADSGIRLTVSKVTLSLIHI